MNISYACVVLPLPLDQQFHYIITPSLRDQLQPGMRVQVPFGTRELIGFCVGFAAQSPVAPDRLRAVTAVVDESPMVDSRMLRLTRWMASYYACSWGEALAAVLPAAVRHKVASRVQRRVKLCHPEQVATAISQLQDRFPAQARTLRLLQQCDGELTVTQLRNKAKISVSPLNTLARKGLISFINQPVARDPFAHLPYTPSSKPTLNHHQDMAVRAIQRALAQQRFATFLLYGITSSGKTEVYLRAIEAVVQQHQEAIVLVPEIALTPQTVARFKQRFAKVAVLHSELTPAQRNYQWHRIYRGEIQVVIGARSALFAPTRRLGLIVVDEEHEPSFKQQSTPRYHARDLAVKRGQLENAVVLLGSATPSLESFHNSQRQRYHLICMPQRIGKVPLPRIILVNMREEFAEQKAFVYFSRALLQELRKTLSQGEQSILFLNRRGFATTINCPRCGYIAKCQHCDIALTYHKKIGRAICHYCNYEIAAPQDCPECLLPGIRFYGAGTQRVEAMLHKFFPQAVIERVDSDTMTGRQRYEKVFHDFEQHKIDILIGTQMIAKGLDFPNVTLVGVISVDLTLNLPDFRAAERTFQLIVQVGGRAGRGPKGGCVVVQTLHPEHYAIQSALHHDYEGFARQELQYRQALGYPPFGRLLRILAEGRPEKQVITRIQEIALALQPCRGPQLQLLGPSPAPLSLLQNRYRWHILLKGTDVPAISRAAQILRPYAGRWRGVKLSIDIDPTTLL